MQKDNWICRVSAHSTQPNGRAVKMIRHVDCMGSIEEGMFRALNSRRDRGHPFLGEEITAVTPLGQKVVRLYNPDTYQLDKVQS